AQRGYIIFGLDNRGTGARGNKFMMATYKNLGDLESQDQIAGARWLARQPYVDGSRIGIWGWSYGGYMTALTFLKAKGLFKVGISVAPVTDWRNYDTIYTERYMLTPEKNPEGYKRSSCLQYVDQLKGQLLIVHGTADDNVHLSNTLQLVYALQNARKPFDLMLYPRKLHGIGGRDTRIHLFNMLTQYILEHL
ncbi:MAG: S9 family peptidase, partial [candidate division KSB1 bacterium]|nr:S9 family peptidase [candidate division KSB1 bacterium]